MSALRERDVVAAAAPPAAPRRWRTSLVAALLLLPLAGEGAMRLVGRDQLAVAALGYLGACVLFALMVRVPDLVPFDLAWPRLAPSVRWAPAGAALLAAAGGVYLAWGNPRQWVLVPIWLAGLALWGAAWWRRRPRAPRAGRGFWAIALVVLLAAALRLYELPTLQPVQVDELVMSEGALRRGLDKPFSEQGLPLFAPVAGDGFSQLRLTEYRRLAFFELGGIQMLSLRLPSVGVGVIEIGLVYLAGRELFGRRVGLVAGLILATLTAHLSFSRHGADYIEGSLVWTASAWLLARGLRRRSVGSFAMAGVVLSLCLYVYMSSRPAPAFALALIALALLDGTVRGRWIGAALLALIGGFLVGAGPMLAAYLKTPSIFLYRSDVTSWLGRAIQQYRESGDPARLWPVWEHLRAALLAYNLNGSADNHYLPGRGFLLWLPAGLMFAALAWSTLRALRWRAALLALWFWTPTLALSFLSEATPPGHRLLPVLPALAVLAALALDRIVVAWERVGGAARRLALPVASVALAASLGAEAWSYFGDYARRDFDRWQDQLTRAVLAVPQGRQVVLVPGPSPMGMELYVEGKPFQWASDLGRRVTGENLGRVVDQLPDLGDRPEGVTYLVHSGLPWWYDVVRAAYPTGRPGQLRSSDTRLPDRLAWLTYDVGPDDLAAARGLDLTVVDAAGRRVERRVDSVALATSDLPNDLRAPLRAEWRGWVRVARPDGAPPTLVSTGSTAPTIQIGDWRSVVAGRVIMPGRFPPGAQPLLVSAELAGAGDRVSLTWDGRTRGQQAPFPAGQAAAWPGSPRVLLEWLPPGGGAAIQREWDVTLADRRIGLRRPRDGAFLLRWSGTLEIAQGGSYEFDVLVDSPIRLSIDGRQLWPRTGTAAARPDGPPDQRVIKTTLAAGRRAIVVEKPDTSGGELTVLWRRGDAPFGIIPAEAFAPIAWP